MALEGMGHSKIVMLLIDSESHSEASVDVARELSKKSVCYVTLNKTRDSIKELFAKNGVNTGNMFFIDAISKTIRKMPDQADDCYFASSSGALTEISVLVSKCLRKGFDYLVFDSLTNLAIYQEKAPVARFVSNLVNQVRQSNASAVFFALNIDEHGALVQECGMLMDKVVKVGGADR